MEWHLGKYEIGLGLEMEKGVMITKRKKTSGVCNVVAEEPHVTKSDVRMHMPPAFYAFWETIPLVSPLFTVFATNICFLTN